MEKEGSRCVMSLARVLLLLAIFTLFIETRISCQLGGLQACTSRLISTYHSDCILNCSEYSLYFSTFFSFPSLALSVYCDHRVVLY